MIRLSRFAWQNVWRSRARSAALLLIIACGVAVLLLIAGGYQYMFSHLAAASIRDNGDIQLSAGEGQGLAWADYLALKAKLKAGPLVHELGAEVPVTGMLGNGERSAVASGLAVETVAAAGAVEGLDATAPVGVQLGTALALTLGLQPGDVFGGLLADQGMTLKLERTVNTEVQLKDRFFIRLPLAVLLADDGQPEVRTIHIWLKRSLPAPNLGAESDSAEYRAVLAALAGLPQLAGFTRQSMPEGNTTVNKIVGIYRSNYAVVVAVVGLTLILAFLNVLSLSVHERQQELGTLRAMGTPLWQIRFMVAAETLWLAVLAWLFGIMLTVVASAIINAQGGLVFAPPPGSDTEIRVGTILSGVAMMQALLLVTAGALLSAVLSSISLNHSSVVEQLAVRD